MDYELRQYSFGETIGKGFNLYFENFIPILLFSLVCQLPLVLLLQFGNLSSILESGSLNFGYFGSLYVSIIWYSLVQCFLSAYIIHLIAKKIQGNNLSGRENNIASIFRIILPVIGLTLLLNLVKGLGYMACFVPGILIALGFSLAVPILVIERRKIRESMTRSWILTQGRKGTVFLVLLVAASISVFFQLVFLILQLTVLDQQLVMYLNYGVLAFINPLDSCFRVVLYYNLRIEKEGFNIEHLAQQFTLADSAQESPPVEI